MTMLLIHNTSRCSIKNFINVFGFFSPWNLFFLQRLLAYCHIFRAAYDYNTIYFHASYLPLSAVVVVVTCVDSFFNSDINMYIIFFCFLNFIIAVVCVFVHWLAIKMLIWSPWIWFGKGYVLVYILFIINKNNKTRSTSIKPNHWPTMWHFHTPIWTHSIGIRMK